MKHGKFITQIINKPQMQYSKLRMCKFEKNREPKFVELFEYGGIWLGQCPQYWWGLKTSLIRALKCHIHGKRNETPPKDAIAGQIGVIILWQYKLSQIVCYVFHSCIYINIYTSGVIVLYSTFEQVIGQNAYRTKQILKFKSTLDVCYACQSFGW